MIHKILPNESVSRYVSFKGSRQWYGLYLLLFLIFLFINLYHFMNYIFDGQAWNITKKSNNSGGVVVLVFTALQHFSGNFGRGQLTYPHCSWTSLLSSLPVLRTHSFAIYWQMPFWISGRDRMAVEIFHSQSPRKNVAGREDRTHDRPYTRRARIWPSYRARLNK